MSAKMERIIVKNLFGKFNYDLNLDNGYEVSILIAPNGFGKTTIFNILSFIFHPTLDEFETIQYIPFDEFSCELSNKTILKLKKEKNELLFIIAISEQLKTSIAGSISVNFNTVSFLQDFLTSDKRLSYNEFMEQKYKEYTEARLSYFEKKTDDYKDDLAENRKNYYYWTHTFDNAQSYDNFTKPIEGFKNLYKNVTNGLSINYTQANRLLIVNKRGGAKDVLDIINNDILNKFTILNNKYGDSLSKGKDKILEIFLTMSFDNNNYQEMALETKRDIVKGLEDYISRITHYNNLNLIEPSNIITKDFSKILERTFLEFDNMSVSNINGVGQFTLLRLSLINMYLQAFSNALMTFEDFYNKLKLLTEILNERNKITMKTFTFSRTDGIEINTDGKILPLKKLSSGEKNDLVMFYNLIFKSKNGGIVLIDEPEISLHIEWQETVLDKMLKICKLNNLQAIISTHSPHIVSGHVELLINGGNLC